MESKLNVGIVLYCSLSDENEISCMHETAGRALLGHLHDRLEQGILGNDIVVLTSADSVDDEIQTYCHRSQVPCYRSGLDAFASVLDSFGWEFVSVLDSRNILIDTCSLGALITIAHTNQFDLVTNFPVGDEPHQGHLGVIRTTCLIDILETLKPTTLSQLCAFILGRENIKASQNDYVLNYDAARNLTIPTLSSLQNLERIKEIINYSIAENRLLTVHEISDYLASKRRANPWQGSVGPLLISEIGGNHEGDFEVAKKMTELAIQCGSDCVKFQLYTGNTLVSPVESPNRNKHFKKFELTKEQHIYLAEMCHSAGVLYSASVWDLEMLEWIDPYLDFYKIGSGDVTAWPILEAFAHKEKPILLSTGLSTLDEVMQTVAFIQKVNPAYNDPNMLCVMQCTSMYPIPDEDANLNVMNTYKNLTGLAVGYSDHTIGMDALKVAVAMGACALEYHFTNDRDGKEFRDHKVSLTPDEVCDLKQAIVKIVSLKGNGIKLPEDSEIENNHQISFRRAVYLNRDIGRGEVIKSSDLVYLRPAHGTDARDGDLMVGATAKRDLKAYEAIVNGIDYIKIT